VTEINGLILAGGQSSRMGLDKNLLIFHGTPQQEFLRDVLKGFCDHIYISCRQNHNIPANLNPLPDDFDFRSPLNGILTAFKKDPEKAWLSVPVDMPYINEKTIGYLIAHRDPTKVATCFFDSDGKNPEPLFAIWEPQVFPLLKIFYNSGKISPRDFLQNHSINMIKAPNTEMHFNVNTPEEFEEFKKRKGHSS
jgi:molybdopterin-guanine dinucleotide biosynthesis protein A